MHPSRLDLLRYDADRLAEAIAEATPSTLPALVREHRAVLAEVEELSAASAEREMTVLDEIAAHRAAKSPQGSSRGRQRRG